MQGRGMQPCNWARGNAEPSRVAPLLAAMHGSGAAEWRLACCDLMTESYEKRQPRRHSSIVYCGKAGRGREQEAGGRVGEQLSSRAWLSIALWGKTQQHPAKPQGATWPPPRDQKAGPLGSAARTPDKLREQSGCGGRRGGWYGHPTDAAPSTAPRGLLATMPSPHWLPTLLTFALFCSVSTATNMGTCGVLVPLSGGWPRLTA